jgi:hypothetical protein
MTSNVLRLALASLSLVASACAPAPKEWVRPTERKYFFFPVRQVAPEPVYARVRPVRPPEVLPPRFIDTRGTPVLDPVVHLDLKNSTLEEVARALASATRYRHYTSSLVADRRLTISKVGTVEELGQEIAQRTGTYVTVDHQNREVRFLNARAAVTEDEMTSVPSFSVEPTAPAPVLPTNHGPIVEGAIGGSSATEKVSP